MEKLLKLIPVFVIVSTLSLIMYSFENENIDYAASRRNLEDNYSICDQNKRAYFKAQCYEVLHKSVRLKNLPPPKLDLGPSYILMSIEFLFNTYLAFFLLGLGYPNFLERFIEKPLIGKIIFNFRKLQEDNMFFILRLFVGVIIWSIFYKLEFRIFSLF